MMKDINDSKTKTKATREEWLESVNRKKEINSGKQVLNSEIIENYNK
jgi:ribonuclease HII